MKFIIIISLIVVSAILSYRSSPKIANPYKTDKNTRHSLYRERDAIDRMSESHYGVPPPINKRKLADVKEPEKLLAARIVDHYRKIFDYLDYSPVDDLLNAEELSEAYKDFKWPKASSDITDDLEYAKLLIQKYDKSGKNMIDFVEFCDLMEDLWGNADLLEEQKCNLSFNNAKQIVKSLFKWLDRDNDGLVNPHDLIFGLSRIMIRDVSFDEIKEVFAKYDEKKQGKIDEMGFMLAIVNGMLDKTLRDPLITETL